ncbi:MAG: threonylcarbamoyl-AMP synthase [Prevotella sp.]|nr:threonylcarbamoyl-AMP synthase [Prevotella sp.]
MDTTEDIKNAVETMKNGGIILYPTDTIWGIGCDATNSIAVEKIYKLKKRSSLKAMICLVDSVERLCRYVRNAPEVALDIMRLAQKPTTIIFDEASGIAERLKAEDGSLAIRVTKEEFSKELCYRFQKPIVSTSANISGEKAASCFIEISPEVINSVDYVCYSRRDEKPSSSASSVIKISENLEITVIRE